MAGRSMSSRQRTTASVVTVAIASLALGSGCTSPRSLELSPETSSSTTPTSSSECTVRGVLPDPICTPGATNPNVTQENISATICKSGWSSKVRPPTEVTNPLERQLLDRYGNPHGSNPADYELDHLIPISLGGALKDPKNLWPEYGPIPNPKDAVEMRARASVCAGRISLSDAQRKMATNWVSLGEELRK